MADSKRNLVRTGTKSRAISNRVSPSTKTPKAVKKVFSPMAGPSMNKQAGTNR